MDVGLPPPRLPIPLGGIDGTVLSEQAQPIPPFHRHGSRVPPLGYQPAVVQGPLPVGFHVGVATWVDDKAVRRSPSLCPLAATHSAWTPVVQVWNAYRHAAQFAFPTGPVQDELLGSGSELHLRNALTTRAITLYAIPIPTQMSAPIQ